LRSLRTIILIQQQQIVVAPVHHTHGMTTAIVAGGAVSPKAKNTTTTFVMSPRTTTTAGLHSDNHPQLEQDDDDMDHPTTMMPTAEKEIAAVQLTIDDAIDSLGNVDGGGRGCFHRRLLWAVGMSNGVNAMVVMVISFLHQTIKIQWDLSSHAASFLSSSVFVGIMAGTFILGPMGDSVGRKPTFLISSTIVAVCGMLSAASPDYYVLILLRFCVGFGVGGTVIPFDTMVS